MGAMILIASLALAALSRGEPIAPGSEAVSPHTLAIKQFASTLAMADMASRHCADILINTTMLDGFRDQLGMTIEDRRDLKSETAFALDVFEKAFREAPSPQAWCDAAYRMYGPDGRMIRGFMTRSADPQVP